MINFIEIIVLLVENPHLMELSALIFICVWSETEDFRLAIRIATVVVNLILIF